jgi:hypothetical protein
MMDLPRDGIKVSGCIKIDILESLWDRGTGLRVVSWLKQIEASRLSSVDL